MGTMPVQVPKREKSETRPRKKPNIELGLREIVDLEDDNFCSESILDKGTNKSNAISVEQYDEDLDLQLALTASRLRTTPLTKPKFIDLSQEKIPFHHEADDDGDDDEIRVLWFSTPKSTRREKEKTFTDPSVTENGQSSNSKNDPSFVCEICVEPKSGNESFRVRGCSHVYCSECMARYVASKLQDNVTEIGCPVSECKGSLEPEYCRSILPQEVFDRWGMALCEALILGSEKFYCPYKDCSVMMIDDGKEIIKESECPSCYRMFCAQCKVPWHAGIDCAEFQKLNKDEREEEDIMLMQLAKKKHWRRCPNCNFYVERKDGCLYMLCRCRTAFCYNCGNIYEEHHSHYCKKCER
ncbi:E3 ubiquitin ligase RBR family [Parasponia andersonii]|uniref:RBR-type E3 ubiquitin transferase n=1 Tax=Parasponia andersonii TaxID=3476 RepID=A0A2P5CYE4_PARAD|nr:E3 ubiquitin ligase RBR family [Parasponia andersonii]